MRVIDVNFEDDPRLLPLIASHPDACVYHHPAWFRTLSAEYGRKILIIGCESQDGQLLGILPLMATRGVLTPIGGEFTKARLSSLPRTPVAGPISISPEALRLLLSAARDRVSQQSRVQLQIKTEGPSLEGLLGGLVGKAWRHSFVLQLPEDPAQLRIGDSSRNRSRIRWSVKRAQRLGLRARWTSFEEYFDKWYELYLETMRRIVVPPRSRRFFQAMSEHLGPLGLMKTMIVERDGEPIAGSIFLMYGRRVFYAFVACPAEHFSLRPVDLMHWEAIHWATQKGFREYDLGEVSHGNSGLESFKAKWGAEKVLLYRYYCPQANIEITNSLGVFWEREGIVGVIWRGLPLWATARLGDLIYGYF